jgi:hypothetical protein
VIGVGGVAQPVAKKVEREDGQDDRHDHRVQLGCDDATRAALAVKGIAGKRLTYRLPHDRT